ncbi:MAG: hypothetical protein A3I89_03920 [Candidatus Harrisonbacteria bacterium RIFCSPLOWO2_02_FULL_41_11]|uniref:Addiction module toxin RelE n=1 Tax=Candidatus Harrisonbacteria bacterium RIFCSPHIGHO2_02_FULL_42_16 TaxID=1798404 RepID=A0A1G1ZHR1_9BACT|nr:MAG: hypothetical protein A3B92_00975 [Candidatus Harrisonbacteria bacterium RIFCSPHIGHO2_02_FULL_42_16]OGY67128.1 MAG: hypothetical protein A3I89_03920 [Candidatus Harrisonbacteria bacterium RIFCSPLOWO2_02_FULL_41_11]
MDKIEKALNKLSEKEKEAIKEILTQLQTGSFKNLDIKKLKGRNDIFRARKGKIRIIYAIDKNKETRILAIERCSEKTYKNL